MEMERMQDEQEEEEEWAEEEVDDPKLQAIGKQIEQFVGELSPFWVSNSKPITLKIYLILYYYFHLLNWYHYQQL